MVRAERLAGPYTAVSAVIVFGLLCFTPPAGTSCMHVCVKDTTYLSRKRGAALTMPPSTTVALKHQASNSAFVLPGHGLLAQRELSKSSATYGSLQVRFAVRCAMAMILFLTKFMLACRESTADRNLSL